MFFFIPRLRYKIVFCTFYIEASGYLVSLSIIGVIQKRFSADLNSPKTYFFEVFRIRTQVFRLKMSFLSLQHVAHLIGRLSCEFEHHQSHTVKFRSVLVRS